MFNIVVATDKNRGIGKDGQLPWPKLKGDLRFYRELTCCSNTAAVEKRYGLTKDFANHDFPGFSQLLAHLKNLEDLPALQLDHPNAVIMGRTTWESLPDKFRPLPNRLNVVLSRQRAYRLDSNVMVASSLEKAFHELSSNQTPNIFVIGGGKLYEEAIFHPQCQSIYLTQINHEFQCDTFFPDYPKNYALKSQGHTVQENDLHYQFNVYGKRQQISGNRVSR